MKIIITMAGEGSRFKAIGLTKPKYMLIAKDKTLFDWSLLSLKNFFQYEHIFLVRKEHHCHEFVKDRCKILGIHNYKIVDVEGLTAGQAATVLLASHHLSVDDPIVIYNIDTYIDDGALKPSDVKGDGWVPAFVAEGDRWSFVKFDENFKVYEAVEKVRISPYATIGLYYFSSLKLYKQIYDEFDWTTQKERYIAPMYSYMIDALNKDVYTTILPQEAVIELGTPDSVAVFDPDYLEKNN